MTHTPGPWHIKPSTANGNLFIYDDNAADIHDAIAGVKFTDNGEANARLIAAAPELLTMLEDALSRLEEFTGTDCECDNTHEANGTKCCLCEYRAVISKAKGETP